MPPTSRIPAQTTDTESRSRGQILVIFAFMLTILIGMAAFVVDIAWIWSHQLQVQRAADAGALAGVVHLPAEPGEAVTAARAESRKNGYRHGTGGVDVEAMQDPGFGRRMIVTVTAPVDTFFMGLFGYDTVTVSRTARAEYVLPVPMGSPQNYYGVGAFRADVTTAGAAQSTPLNVPGGAPSGGQWTATSGSITDVVTSDNTAYAQTNTNNRVQQWDDFDLEADITAPGSGQSVAILGIEVELTDVHVTASCANSRVRVQLWNETAGTWTTAPAATSETPNLGTNTSNGDYTLGGATNLWGRTWTRDDFDNAEFRVQLTSIKGCATSGTNLRVDRIRVRVHYQMSTTTQQVVPITGPSAHGSPALAPQNFWASVGSLGWPTTRGDAYLSYYLSRPSSPGSMASPGGTANAQFDPRRYYNYAVEMPAGGDVWIFDPAFCNRTGSAGTSETWVTTGTNGPPDPNSRRPFSTQYNLFLDSSGTPYDYGDDSWVASSDNLFRRSNRNFGSASAGTDTNPAASACTNADATYTNAWYPLATGLAPGNYRLHTTNRIFTEHSAALSTWDTTDDQFNTAGGNYFAIWTNAGGKIYGLGAMSAQFQLESGQASEFYLAQIESIHAGKWIDIDLWDIGDGGRSQLEILAPGATSYQPISFYWNRNTSPGATIPADFTCGPTTSSATSQLEVNNGSSNMGENHWIRICLKLPDNYTAPLPSSDTVATAGGWWKIRYRPDGGQTSDVTTWQVAVRGNPAHLITPGDDSP